LKSCLNTGNNFKRMNVVAFLSQLKMKAAPAQDDGVMLALEEDNAMTLQSQAAAQVAANCPRAAHQDRKSIVSGQGDPPGDIRTSGPTKFHQ
jgi:hypothetical protein